MSSQFTVTLAFVPLVAIGEFLLTLRAPRLALLTLLSLEVFTPAIPVGPTTLSLAKIALLAGLSAIARHNIMLSERRVKLFRNPAWLTVPVNRVLVILSGLIIATALTGIQARYPGAVIRETAKALEYLGIVIFAAHAAKYPEKQSRFAAFAVGFAGLIFVVAFLALLQEWTGAPSVFRSQGHLIPRIGGPLEGPNQLAAYVGIAIPVLYCFAQEFPHLLLFSALSFALITEILTFSRGGIVTTALALAIVMFRTKWQWRSVDRIVLAAIAVGIVSAVFIAGPGIGHLASFDNAGPTGGVGHRGELWRAAFFFWRHHPWLGIGSGNFERELATAGLIGVHTHANSLYLQAFAEGGILLGSITILSVIVPLQLLAQTGRQSSLTRGTFAAGVGLALHQCIDTLTFYPKIGILWWILAGYALNIQLTDQHQDSP